MRVTTEEIGIALLSIVTLMVKCSISAKSAYSNANDKERIKFMQEHGVAADRAAELCLCQPIWLVTNEGSYVFRAEDEPAADEFDMTFSAENVGMSKEAQSLVLFEDFDSTDCSQVITPSLRAQLFSSGVSIDVTPVREVPAATLCLKAAANRLTIVDGLIRDLHSIEQSDNAGNRRGPMPEDFKLRRVLLDQATFCLFTEVGDVDEIVVDILSAGGFTYDRSACRIYTSKGWLAIKGDIAPVSNRDNDLF